MAPYLATVRSFADVRQTEAGVDTLEFLEAANGVVGIFDLLGSTAFSLVSNDLKGNIGKVRARYDEAPGKSPTLEELVRNEMEEKKRTATQGLLWLIRGLTFTCKALKATQQNAALELSAAFQNAYDGTLKKFHNFIVRAVFSTAMSACPKRDVLYTKLKDDKAGGPAATEEELNELLDRWLEALGRILSDIDGFYELTKYGEGL